ncbi:MAG: glucosamine-6-phosphate deaminase [Clostridia bacterium]|nr:glucosamine-6-phosphate deaminase [Clostridia bacterium]
MRLIVCENYEEMSETVAKLVASQLTLKPDSVLGLATGSTPVGMYKILADMCSKGEISFKEVTSFNLDEYYPISADNEQSYRYFMNQNLFSKVDINIENTFVPDGSTTDPKAECKSYEKRIAQAGGIDLQILGIGKNGHIGFNEPDANLNSQTHLTDLTESTIKANSRFFDSYDDVPKQALTMGIGSILRAKRIILMASGVSKHRVVSELLAGGINTDIPASMLKLHSQVILVCDKAAYSSERIGVDIGGTDIKFGVLDENNNIVYQDIMPTDNSSEQALINQIVTKCEDIMSQRPITGIGVGTPGIIRNGVIINIANLPLKNVNLGNVLSERLPVSVEVSNDGNCAALGEAMCGAAKDAKNIVMVTFGTGIGGGIIIDNKIYQGRGSAGEIGHICIEKDGRKCGCGNKGCWEQYASVTALVKEAKKAAEENSDSILNDIYRKNGKLSGRLIFEAIRKGCPVAQSVFDKYTDYVAMGLKSLEFVFDPDMIVLSGGITGAGEDFLNPIVEKLDSDIPVVISSLKSDAGVVGAAMM